MANTATNFIASVENDANAVLATLVQDVANIRTGIANAAPAVNSAIQIAEKDALAVLSSATSVAAAPSAITISGAIIPVWNAFVDIFELVKGFIEGVQGKPAASSNLAEQAGDTAGQDLRDVVVGAMTGNNAANKPQGNQ